MMDTQTIEITPDGQGGYGVEMGEEEMQVGSLDELLQLLQQRLAGPGQGPGPADAWAAEAAGRDEAGYRRPRGGPMQALA